MPSSRSRSRSQERELLEETNDHGGGSTNNRRPLMLLALVSFALVNLYSPVMLSTILRAYQTSDSSPSSSSKKTTISTKTTYSSSLSSKQKLEKLATIISTSGLPQVAPNTTGGFVHVGKTGGSTLTRVLRNGCHAFLERPCHLVPDESIVSQTVTYYHTPDWNLLTREPHDYYIWTVRDPFARTVSAFLYQHPYNVYIRRRQYDEKVYNFPMRKLYPVFNRCFKTLDLFAQALKHDYQRETKITWMAAKTLKCEVLANAMFQHKAEILNHHLHFDYRMFYKPFKSMKDEAFFAVRTEFLWDDWITINELLGQAPGTVVSNETKQLRNTSKYVLPVKGKIGDTEREYLCKRIEPEYHMYFQILSEAINLNEEDVNKMKEMARTNCPNLEMLQ